VLIKWNLNKTENSSSKKKERIKLNSKSGSNSKIFEEEFNEAMRISKTTKEFDFQDYLENLNDLENNLLNNPNPENFADYKYYVKLVSNKLLKNAFKMSSIKDIRKKEYYYIKTIDDNLGQLFNAIMKKTENREKIISLVGSIKGLIMDLKV